MIIKSFELKNYIKRDINIFLFYGQNIDLINETIDKNIKPFFSKNLYNYEEAEILSNKDSFIEGLFNKSFFEQDKLIIINRVTDKLLELVRELLEKDNNSIRIILKSGILEKKSKLRNYFEKNKDLIVIPFYEDNYQTLHLLAANFFKDNKIKISNQNINYILEKTKGNRINLKNELEKIRSFSHNKQFIEIEDLVKITSSAEDYKISELTDQCLAKNKKKTINILNENNNSLEDNILILKSFLYKLKRLKKLKEQTIINKNLDQIISSYKPPIFWKDKEIIKQQLLVWSEKEIRLLIKKINDLELIIKKNSTLSNHIINNFILERLEKSNNLI